MASALGNPLEASIGAAVGAATGSLSGATWLGSQFAKFGRYLAGTPGEVSAAALGAGTGAAAGAAVGAALGALSGRLMVAYVLEGNLANATTTLFNVATAPLQPFLDSSPRGSFPGPGQPSDAPSATVPPAPSLFPKTTPDGRF